MIPDDVIDDAERLTRLARTAVDPNEAAAHRERRDDLLAEHGYTARVRSDDRDDTLVLHPADWLEDGEVVIERVDVEEGVEIELSGTGDADEWAAVDEHNRAAAEAVVAEHGEVHGANARSLADFAGNHYAKRVEELTPAERREFVEEYFPRNAWPSDDQREAVEESVELTREHAGE
ncbi:DUF7108 family protein [Halosegnis marinus]|uniref:RnhA operon protein n=1 Tax=Halosegnis marinus TaxID=3034023 RepID=A0ABD5ZMG7_9EURY|nr:rnhA operon protein [Halosegnis sp. DT85]